MHPKSSNVRPRSQRVHEILLDTFASSRCIVFFLSVIAKQALTAGELAVDCYMQTLPDSGLRSKSCFAAYSRPHQAERASYPIPVILKIHKLQLLVSRTTQPLMSPLLCYKNTTESCTL